MTGKLSLAPTLLKGRFSSEKYFRNFWGVKQLENSIEYFYKTEQKRWEIVALESTLRMLRVRLCVFAAEKDLINPAAAKIGRQARWREPSLCTRTPRRSCTSPRGLASEERPHTVDPPSPGSRYLVGGVLVAADRGAVLSHLSGPAASQH